MVGVVILIDGWDPVANAAVSLYAGSHDHPAVCHLNGSTWWPALAKLPTLRYDLFDGAFAGQIVAPSSSLTMRTEPWPAFGRYQLADARFRLWTGEVGAAWSTWTLRFDGRVTGQPTIRDGAAEISFAVDDRWLDAALLLTYAGTTGAEGSAALKGQAKPLSIGAPRYVPGTLVDSVNSVFQVSAFGINGVEAALERLARFGTAQGDYPTYDALVAASLPRGTWATCKAAGLVRFGAPPTGTVSFLVQGDAAGADGWVRLPGRVIRRLATIAGGGDRVDAASLAALDTARPYNVSIYFDQQTTAREVIQSLAASLNCVAGVSWTGQLFVVPVAIGAADVVLAADGSALPPVESVQQVEQAAPWRRLALSAERAWTVHALADIAFAATLVDLGAYVPGTTYREGNIVQSQGSSWLYQAAAPSAGNPPPTLPTDENSYWRVLAKAGTKGADGQSAYSAFLTNETHTLPADPAGNVGNYAGATGAMRVFAGAADASASFTLSTADNPQALTVSYSGQTYNVTGGFDASEDTATLTIRATGSGAYAGASIDKVFSLAKSKAGAGGANAKILYVTSTSQTLTVSASGTLDPAGTAQNITFTAVKQNTAAKVSWAVKDQNGNTIISTDGDSVTLNAGDMLSIINNAPGGRSLTVTGTLVDGTTLTDTVSVSKVQAGSNGVNGAKGTDGAAGANGKDGAKGETGAIGAKGADGTTWYSYFAYANSPDGAVDFTTGEPGTRAYVGTGTGTSPTDPTSPTFYSWSPYKGPPFGLSTRGNAVVAGDQVIKNGGSGDFDSDAFSTVGYRGGAVASFRLVGNGQVMAGLNTDPLTDPGPNSIDYALYRAGGTVYAFESGNIVQDLGGCDDSTRLVVEYRGSSIVYSKNGAVVRGPTAVAADQLLYFDSSLQAPGARIVDIGFAARGTDGTNGTSAPQPVAIEQVDGAMLDPLLLTQGQTGTAQVRAVYRNNSQAGTVQVQLQYRANNGGWNYVAQASVNVQPGEPAGVSFQGSYTNPGSVDQLVQFRIVTNYPAGTEMSSAANYIRIV